MRRIVLVLFFVLSLVGCKKREVAEETKYPIHIISKYFRENKELQKRYSEGDTSVVPPPIMPEYLYGSDNFILDDSLNIFYYKTDWVAEFCATGIEHDTIPIYEKIEPKNIIEIPINSINDFVKLNLKKGERNMVKIGSQLDTLKSSTYFKLQEALDKHLSYKEDRDLYVAYRTTQEEDSVLHYKKQKKNYNPDSIKWDLKRIRFPQKK